MLSALLVPVLLLHRHYDDAIAELTDRLERYRRVAAQAPELRKALDAMREKDGRRFFLKNTAPNLAGAELAGARAQAAIESNGGRITTSQNSGPEGRRRASGSSPRTCSSSRPRPNLQKILYALETQQPYLVVDNMTMRPLNAFRGFKPAPGQEPEINVQLDVVGWAFPSAVAGREPRRPRPPPSERRYLTMNALIDARSPLVWLAPFAALAAAHRLGDRLGPRVRGAAPRRRGARAAAGGASRCLPEYQIDGGAGGQPRHGRADALQSRRAVRRPRRRRKPPKPQDASAASSR